MQMYIPIDQRVNFLHVDEKNYVKFFELLYPHIKQLVPTLSKRYWLEPVTVEEICCLSILSAIKKWKPSKKKSCKFSSWYWTHARCNLTNESKKETKESLNRIKYFDYAKLNDSSGNIINDVANTYGLQQVIKSAMKVPEFKELINYIHFFFSENGRNPIAKALKVLAKKHHKSLYWEYILLNRLKVFLQSACEYQEIDMGTAKIDVPSRLICIKCGGTSFIHAGRKLKLLRQYGSVCEMHKKFRCRDCSPKAEKRKVDYSVHYKEKELLTEGGI